METLFRHIEYLLTSSRSVAVSGLGTFFVHRFPAYYDDSEGVFFPPRYTFSFSKKEGSGDILLKSVMRREKLSRKEAVEMISRHAQAINSMLERGETVSMGRMGSLVGSPEGRVIFNPSDAALIMPETCWLPELKLRTPSVKSENIAFQQPVMPAEASTVFELIPGERKESSDNYVPAQEIFEPEIDETVDRKAIRWRRVKIFSRYAAAVVACLAVCAALFLPREQHEALVASVGLQELINRGSSMPSSDEEALKTNYPVPTMVMVLNSHENEQPADETLETKSDENLTATKSDIASSKRNDKLSLGESSKNNNISTHTDGAAESCFGSTSGRYCLVVASLSSESEAKRYISERPGKGLNYFESDGRYRVYAAAGDDKAQLDRLKRDARISGSYKGAWVARR